MVVSRVTHQLMASNFINDIQRNLKSLNELQRQISTGKKIRYPSDDPIGADRSLDYRQTVAQTEQFSRNVDDLNSTGANVDGVLDTITALLMRARDLAMRGSNEAPQNQLNRDVIANEINHLLEELVYQANQKFDGKYLLSGYKTDTTPFTISNTMRFTVGAAGAVITMPSYRTDGGTRTTEAIADANTVTDVRVNGASIPGYTIDPTTNSITLPAPANAGDVIEVVFNKYVRVEYQGDTGTREVEISEGAKLGVTFPGASADGSVGAVFGEMSSEPTDFPGVEAFQYLMDLRDSLYKYDDTAGASMDGIQRGVSDIDEILKRINETRTDLGGRMNRLELAKNRLENIRINTKELLSKKEDVDMAEAITDLALQQNIYQAALGAGARILQVSLLDFLR
ncbi:MAG: flagellar hook-associated protein FlgL [bacterium]